MPDHARELTAKGFKQAEKVAAFLRPHLPDDHRILVSPAIRAQQTAAALTKHFTAGADHCTRSFRTSCIAGCALAGCGRHGSWWSGISRRWVRSRRSCWAATASPLSIKKGALWWFSRREREGSDLVALRLVIAPEFLSASVPTREVIMFESAELGHKIDKATYDAEVPQAARGAARRAVRSGATSRPSRSLS